jgi:hypothetical protein
MTEKTYLDDELPEICGDERSVYNTQENRVCQLPVGHSGYHEQGGASWGWEPLRTEDISRSLWGMHDRAGELLENHLVFGRHSDRIQNLCVEFAKSEIERLAFISLPIPRGLRTLKPDDFDDAKRMIKTDQVKASKSFQRLRSVLDKHEDYSLTFNEDGQA